MRREEDTVSKGRNATEEREAEGLAEAPGPEALPEREPKPEPLPERVMVPVRLVRRFTAQVRGAETAALVEWQIPEDLARAVVPAAEIVRTPEGQAFCPQDVLDAGLPWGLPWEQYITLTATALGLARALRRRGYWEVADVARDPQGALKAFTSEATRAFHTMLRAAERGERST